MNPDGLCDTPSFEIYKKTTIIMIITSPADLANDLHRLAYVGTTFTFTFPQFDGKTNCGRHMASSVAVSKTFKTLPPNASHACIT